MKRLTKWMTCPLSTWCFGGLGDAFLIVGIITAAIDATFAAFTPVIWFLLAFACYLGMIWVVVMRILARLESQAQS